MHRLLTILLAAAALQGCSQAPDRVRSAHDTPREPVSLVRTLAIEEARPDPAPSAATYEFDDGLTLKPTELHPDLGIGDRDFRVDQTSAMNGDQEAALRVARMFQRGTNGVPRDERRMVLWLRRASDLNNGSASYELYLHYLKQGLDREALRYEKRALDQGYTPPPRLDPRRG
jgi:TPR repeat protein